jgi:hypothetical protein
MSVCKCDAWGDPVLIWIHAQTRLDTKSKSELRPPTPQDGFVPVKRVRLVPHSFSNLWSLRQNARPIGFRSRRAAILKLGRSFERRSSCVSVEG